MFIQTANALGTVSTGTNSALLNSQMEFGDFVLFGISIIVLFAGVFSILYILWGGVLLILSGGKDDKIKPAINSIRYALIGLAVIVLSIFIFPKIAALLGLDVSKYSQPEKIFNQIRIIGDKVFNTSSTQYLDSSSSTTDTTDIGVDFSDL